MIRFDGKAVEEGVIRRMTDIIAHRGPDGEGQWRAGPIGLGHRRLSIIDLSAAADQPMVSDDGRMVIVFNGEIYNYQDLMREIAAEGVRCRSTSDTEVILQLYRLHGPDFVSRLRGMFAFAIWDSDRQQMFVARDRVGIKPLYYLCNKDAFVFGSEIKAVIASGCSDLRVSDKALAGLMRFLVVPQPDSIFTDVLKLEPGRTLLIKLDGSVREDVYWSPPNAEPFADAADEADWIERLDSELNESIRYHLVADVPVSAFLSGGLDSSAVVTLMRRQAPDASLDTFSIGFPGQLDFDEGVYAGRVAEYNDTNQHLGTINESFMTDLADIVWYLDEPFAISSAYATYYLARHAASSTKVVLTGDGGDELFAGYEGYKDEHYLAKLPFARLINLGYETLFHSMALLRSRNPLLLRTLNALRKRLGSEGLRYAHRSAQNSLTANSKAFTADYYYPSIGAWKRNLMAYYYDHAPSPERLRKKLYAEYKTRLVDEMLMKVDRMTMAHSLEARVPLLDHEVVEFAFSVPSGLKLRRNTDGRQETKYLLKRTMERYLPRDIIYRKKQGFYIPMRSWMSGRFLSEIGDRLMSGRLRCAGVVHADGLSTILRDQAANRFDYTNMLLLLLVLETWAENYEGRFGSLSWS